MCVTLQADALKITIAIDPAGIKSQDKFPLYDVGCNKQMAALASLYRYPETLSLGLKR